MQNAKLQLGSRYEYFHLQLSAGRSHHEYHHGLFTQVLQVVLEDWQVTGEHTYSITVYEYSLLSTPYTRSIGNDYADL